MIIYTTQHFISHSSIGRVFYCLVSSTTEKVKFENAYIVHLIIVRSLHFYFSILFKFPSMSFYYILLHLNYKLFCDISHYLLKSFLLSSISYDWCKSKFMVVKIAVRFVLLYNLHILYHA